MKLFIKRSAPVLGLLGLGLASCQPDIDNPKSSAGQADYSKFVAVGNSLTAGYGDNGLYLEGQQTSFPALLAQQFQQVGGGAFNQALFSSAQANGSGYLKISNFDATGNPVIVAETSNLAVIPGSLKAGTNLLTRYTGTDNQNLGVPGIRVADVLTAGYGLNNPLGFNPFFERLLPAGSPTTYLQYVQERVNTLKPTFFTDDLGNNDVLGYATSGGADPTAPLSTVADFTTKYAAVVDALTVNGAKGVVVTIPNVTNVPFFTTVPTAAVMAQINATPIPAALEPTIKAALGIPQTSPLPTGLRFALYIATGTGTTATKRLATASDLLLLTSRSVINTPSTVPTQPFPVGVGLEIPGAPATTAAALANASNALPSQYVLDATEATATVTRTGELNAVIAANAQRKGLALFDANTYFTNLSRTGLVINGVSNSTAFVSGGLFSLDGVHPTPRFYAVIANEIIKVANAQYGSAVPGVDATQYRGVKFPN